jgi:SAM-dependent methyltransferase/aryl carrier-like protein
LGLLFPEGDAVTAATLYGDTPAALAANGLVQRLIGSLLQQRPAGRSVRVLEIGAGTGGTTSHLLPALPAAATEYTFTDIAPLFVHRAAEKFRNYPFVRCSVLDIEQAPAAQGFEPYAYDLVVAANVLHATSDLRQSVRHVRELLAPGGLLVLLEGTARLRFIDLIFGLTEGWWRFADRELRPAHPLLSAEQWQTRLEECGFRHAGSVASPRESGGIWSTQALIIAKAEERETVSAQAESHHWLILAQRRCALADALRAQIKAAGDVAALVYPGEAYERLTDGALRIDPANPADYRRLLEETAAERGIPLARVVQLWGAAPPPAAADEDLERAAILGWGAALHLVQAMDACEGRTPELWLVTRGAQPVGREKLPGVVQSPLWGFGKVVNLEYPEMRGVCVDLDAGDEERAARNLFEEIRRRSPDDQVAFRGGRRYVARLSRHRAIAKRTAFAIRPDGTYLITGGQRGLGLATAKWLVERGARSLVLIGRSARDAEISEDLAELRRDGAIVETMRADVSDAEQVARVLAHIEADLPPLRGIVHAAGVLDDGALAQQTPERFRRVLAPKMLGAWHLHRLTRRLPLDFFVLYSSLASLLGSAGQANHAAANAFLDALAHHRRGLSLPALSINWGVWSEIGAAVRHQVGQRVRTQGLGTITPRQGMLILDRLMSRQATQVGVTPIDWAVLGQRFRAGRKPPFFANFADQRRTADLGGPEQPVDLKGELRTTAPAERRARVTAHLREQVAGVLRLAPDDVDLQQPLNRIGLDSLMAVELRNRLRSQLGLDVPLVRFMEDASITGLAAELSPSLAEPGSEPDSMAPLDPEPLLARLDQFTDAEVDALLSAALADDPDLLASAALAAAGGRK